MGPRFDGDGHNLPETNVNGYVGFNVVWNIEEKQEIYPKGKVVLYRDTGSVKPGSRPFFGSVSGWESQFLVIDNAKSTFFSLWEILWALGPL